MHLFTEQLHGWHCWSCMAVLASVFNKFHWLTALGICDFFYTSNLHLRTLNWSLFRVLKCNMFWIYRKKKTQKPKEKKKHSTCRQRGKNDKQSVDRNKNFYKLNIYKLPGSLLSLTFIYWLLLVISIKTSTANNR